MKKLCFTIFLGLMLIGGTANATFINDAYLHPLDSNSWQVDKDIIGVNPPFEIYGYEWFSGGTKLGIKLDWFVGGDQAGAELGDVFLGGYYNLAVALGAHDGFDIGDVFVPTQTILSDDLFPLWDKSHYGDNEIVRASGRFLYDVKVTYDTAGIGNSWLYIDFGNNMETSIIFAQTCANDKISGVPEPGTLMLLGLGLLGLGFGIRRKMK